MGTYDEADIISAGVWQVKRGKRNPGFVTQKEAWHSDVQGFASKLIETVGMKSVPPAS